MHFQALLLVFLSCTASIGRKQVTLLWMDACSGKEWAAELDECVWEVEGNEHEYYEQWGWKQTVKELVVPCPFYKCLSSPRVLL